MKNHPLWISLTLFLLVSYCRHYALGFIGNAGLGRVKAFRNSKVNGKILRRANVMFESQAIGDTAKDNGKGDPNSGSMLSKLMKISNFASALCVIDCTVLPLVVLILPLAGLNASSTTAAWFHTLGHNVALFFVLPVGFFTSTLNYLSNHKIRYWISALIGLLLIYVSNSHTSFVSKIFSDEIMDLIHHGTTHRIVNICGCLCLLLSNYFAHRDSSSHQNGDSCCAHDHK